MFQENLKTQRKAKGLSQEELSIRLGVVRQTVSKWEKGRSVPDADLLVKIAEVLDTTVSELLGAKLPDVSDRDRVAEQLSRINEQLAVRNRRAKLVLKVILGIMAAFIAFNLLLVAVSMISFHSFRDSSRVNVIQSSESYVQP